MDTPQHGKNNRDSQNNNAFHDNSIDPPMDLLQEWLHNCVMPLPLDPEHESDAELPLDDKQARHENLLAGLKSELERAGYRLNRIEEGFRTIPNRFKEPSDVPPACLDTREGLAAFRAMLPSVRVVFRAGGWGRLAPLAKLWLAYCLCRAVPALAVRESWKLVRAK